MANVAPRRRLKAAALEVEAEEAAMDRPAQHASGTVAREPMHETAHGEPRRTRRRKSSVQDDMFYLPLNEIPEGSSYEWKRWSVSGLEDPFYIAQMREQGWEPVNPKNHPTWVPPGYSQPHIIKGGMILMERPAYLTQEAQKEQRALAKQQMREAEQRLGMTPKGELTRQHEGVEPRIVKEMMRPIPIEE